MVKKTLENQVAIYTLSWNRLEYTQRCIKSIQEKAAWPYFHLVIDQGSTDGSAEWLDENYRTNNTEILLLRKNIGIPRSVNIAHTLFMGAGFNWIAKIDNDCEMLSDNCLRRLMDALLESPTDLVLSPYVKGLVSHKGGVGRGLPGARPQRWDKHNISYTTGIGGIFRVCHRRVLERFGNWDETKPLHWAEDLDFTGRWEQLDFLSGYMEDNYCLHMDSTLGQQEKYPEYFKEHAGKIDPTKFPDYVKDF